MRFFLSMMVGGLFLGALGCGKGNPCPVPSSPATFEIGTGDTCFQRLTAGQTVPVNADLNTKIHVWAAVGCADCGGTVPITFGVKDPATKQWLGEGPLEMTAELTGGDWSQLAGMTAYLPGDTEHPAAKLPKGTHVLLSATAKGPDGGELHTTEVEVVLGDEQKSSCKTPDEDCDLQGLAQCCYYEI